MLSELACPLALTAHLILPPSHLLLVLLSAIMPAADCGPESFNSHHLEPHSSQREPLRDRSPVGVAPQPSLPTAVFYRTRLSWAPYVATECLQPTKGWVTPQGLWVMGPRMGISRMFQGQAIAAGLTSAKNHCPRKIHSAGSKRDLSLLSRVFADLLPPLRRLWGWERLSQM